MTVAEPLARVLKPLLLQGSDLGRVNLMLLGDFGQRLVAADGLQGDLGLEGRGVVATGSFHG
jgi:hypothetical protein